MSKHTPGPWIINGNKIDGNGYHLASVNSHSTTEGRANAQLIAAAPELIEALELCRSHMYEHASNTQDGAFDKLCSAIAKATGESQ